MVSIDERNEGASLTIADENNHAQEEPDEPDPHEHLELAPFVGKEFSTDDDARRFYNNFAYRRGFSTRKGNHYVSARLEKETMIKYVCSMEGFLKKPAHPTTPEKDKPSSRTGCKARMKIRWRDGVWKVSVFEDVHNHPLITSPSKIRNLRSHKDMNDEDRECINDMRAQNIQTGKIHQYLGARHGGTKNLKFKKRDMKKMKRDEENSKRMNKMQRKGRKTQEYDEMESGQEDDDVESGQEEEEVMESDGSLENMST
ncbi:hypothetical protein LUZ61_017188 [Rhynchospora tenuis]|uniref:FAR1 domain-containing protein n=1 Tax=Rhynchospora tenuis TaxID=198213 RepID=A0AAD6EKS6_9POAL|nr:hypothetical protein LUZ61_017188 [Rhynchospora tenuis]